MRMSDKSINRLQISTTTEVGTSELERDVIYKAITFTVTKWFGSVMWLNGEKMGPSQKMNSRRDDFIEVNRTPKLS